jgi:hypothetical protein
MRLGVAAAAAANCAASKRYYAAEDAKLAAARARSKAKEAEERTKWALEHAAVEPLDASLAHCVALAAAAAHKALAMLHMNINKDKKVAVTWARPRRKATGVWQAATQDLSKLWKPSQEPRPLPERRV